jgi:hypothetical protein
VIGISPPITPFPLSTTVSGGSGTVGLTKIVLEVEGMSEGGATYPSSVLSCLLDSSELTAYGSASHQ